MENKVLELLLDGCPGKDLSSGVNKNAVLARFYNRCALLHISQVNQEIKVQAGCCKADSENTLILFGGIT